MPAEPTVFVVDDDQAMRDALSLLLKAGNLQAEIFPDAKNFLETYSADRPGCLLLDVRMPGMSGLELQEKLIKSGICLPIILITGHGDVAMAVRAMKAGALDFIEKPFSSKHLLERIQEALAQDAHARRCQAQHAAIASRVTLLSPREFQVLERVVAGHYNKIIAMELGIGISTVEAHRKRVMEKLQAESLTDLVRIMASYRALHANDHKK